MRYREDRKVTNEHGQVQAYCDWMGGPTLASVTLTHKGKRIKVTVTGEPDTLFSVPAQHKSGNVRTPGWLGCEGGLWQWHPRELSSYAVEWTDTFGGEANYCWVDRSVVQAFDIDSAARKAKAARYRGSVRVKKDNQGDTVRLDVVGAAVCCFVTWHDVAP